MSDEKQTKKKFCSILKDMGFFYYCTNDRGRSGVPDVYAIAQGSGRSLWFELKKLKKEKLSHPLTVQQSLFLRDINKNGGLGIMLIELPDGSWHYERITDVGEINELDWKSMDLVEFLKYV